MNAIRLTLALLLVLAGHATDVCAHLAIIRQGPESRGGIETNDHAGAALAVGDFNGDGYDDLAVGAPGENLGTATDAGAVIVSWGSKHGLTHVGAQLLTASGVGHADQGDAQFGFALAAADFNDDGRVDLVIGAPFENIGATVDAGAFYVCAGTASGLSTSAVRYDQTSGGGGIETGDEFGASFAIGNFNADAAGYPDLAVGSPGEDGDAGAVFINYLGSLTGLTTASAIPVKQSTLGGTNDAGDRFGEALAAGNLLSGTGAELAVGAPGNGAEPFPATGMVWVLLAGAGGIVTGGSYQLDALDLGGSLQSGARFGSALATGRLYSGSFRSLAIGEPNRLVPPYPNAGRVYVVEGGPLDFDYVGSVQLTKANASGSLATDEHFGAALATGDWNGVGGLEELAVGVPDDHLGRTDPGYGRVFLFPGGTNGPGNATNAFRQDSQGDPVELGDRHGAAIAFGEFDETNKGGLAIGAPGEGSETPVYAPASFTTGSGAVHVIMPWAQPSNPLCYTALVTDCAGEPVYSLKPFDQVKIASTTKLMTLLLAGERIQSGAFDLEDTYVVPAWASANTWVNGTQANPPLEAGEELNLLGLLTYMIFDSGNDATYCVADLLEGGGGQTNPSTYVDNIEDFVADMNVKAAALGLTRTHFTNPNGFDSHPSWMSFGGDHHSTADDMERLMRAGMQNQHFKDIAGRESLVVLRGNAVSKAYYSWGVVKAPKVVAGKPGGTPLALTTGVSDGYDPLLGHVVVTTFGHPDAPTQLEDTMELYNLGFGACGISPIFADGAPFFMPLVGASTADGSTYSAGAEMRFAGDLWVDLHRQSGNLPTTATVELGKQSTLSLPAGETATLGIRPFDGHLGYTIVNTGSAAIRLELTLSAGTGGGIHTIPAGGELTVPAHPGILSTFTLGIENADATGVPAAFTVEERYVQTFPSIPAPAPGPFRTWRMFRDPHVTLDGSWVEVRGLDSGRNPGSLYVSAHEGDEIVDVPDLPAPEPVGIVRLSATPNPSRDRTRLAIDLPTPADLSVTIHDVAGREVARFDAGRRAPGRFTWDWDGTSRGAQVRSGIYFARVVADGVEAASTRVTRLR